MAEDRQGRLAESPANEGEEIRPRRRADATPDEVQPERHSRRAARERQRQAETIGVTHRDRAAPGMATNHGEHAQHEDPQFRPAITHPVAAPSTEVIEKDVGRPGTRGDPRAYGDRKRTRLS